MVQFACSRVCVCRSTILRRFVRYTLERARRTLFAVRCDFCAVSDPHPGHMTVHLPFKKGSAIPPHLLVNGKRHCIGDSCDSLSMRERSLCHNRASSYKLFRFVRAREKRWCLSCVVFVFVVGAKHASVPGQADRVEGGRPHKNGDS